MQTPTENPVNKISVNIEDEMKRSYMDYAMSVIIGRALPDVRDGLKPVHRRCLYAMYDMSNDYNKPYKKSARVVGDVIGKYHPHGDTAAYDTIVRMAQDFSLRYMLVDGQGNFGSVDGDRPAAMRYTEIRMRQLSHELLADLDKETVNMVPNYNEEMLEPTVLPSKFPNLLVNGSTGIAVGMATNIPPHNLGEVIDGIIAVIRNPEISFEELLEMVPGPDFPTGATIYGREGIRDAYSTGRGIIQIRAKAHVEASKRSERQAIVVTEIPYQVNKARLIEKIAELVKEKKVEGISEIRDESDRQGMRIVIEVKRDENAEVLLNQLYKQTQMQAILRHHHAGHRPQPSPRPDPAGDDRTASSSTASEVVTRRTNFELKKAQARAHILEGLKIALDWLDAVIEMIRESKTPPEAKQGLMEGKFADPEFLTRLNCRVRSALRSRCTVRDPGPGDPGDAPAAPDRPRAGQDHRRVRRDDETDRPSPGDPGVRYRDPEDHRRRTDRDQGAVRRRAPLRDRRQECRDLAGGHHRRRGDGRHHLPHRLHQAERR